MASVSLYNPESKKEEGENLLIQISFSNFENEQKLEAQVKDLVSEIDHHHLTDDKEFGFSSYKDLASWLDQRLKKMGSPSSEITIHVNPNKSFRLKNSC